MKLKRRRETDAQLSCKDLCLGYDGREIVHKLNFSVRKGDYLCIVGENGSGKTTLMKTLLGLQPPMYGSVETGAGLEKNEIGYLPQQTLVQRDFPASVWEIVISGCQSRMGLRPFYGPAEKKIAQAAIDRLHLTALARSCYRDLSGGQQQRVLLARALCATRRLLLLDEPVAGLDPIVTQDMYQIIEELNRKDGITVIMVTHDIAAAMKYATHILHIGGTVFFGTKEEYMTSAAFTSLQGGAGRE